jgi:hypothetical protein
MSGNKTNETDAELSSKITTITTKQTAELISNWYQSYYSWNLAYINSSVMMNSNPFLTSFSPIITNLG